jgi:hypothetical protein
MKYGDAGSITGAKLEIDIVSNWGWVVVLGGARRRPTGQAAGNRHRLRPGPALLARRWRRSGAGGRREGDDARLRQATRAKRVLLY